MCPILGWTLELLYMGSEHLFKKWYLIWMQSGIWFEAIPKDLGEEDSKQKKQNLKAEEKT